MPGEARAVGSTGSLAAVRRVESRLLASLPREVVDDLSPQMVGVDHPVGRVLFEPGDCLEEVIFPCRGMVLSLISVGVGARPVETALIGTEGATGAILGSPMPSAFARCSVLAGGTALHVPADAFRAALAASPAATARMDCYAQALLAQLHQAAACAALHPVEARVSRWMLGLHDRLGDRPLPMTQESLAERLGVRRTTITRVIGILEEKGLIRHRRSRVQVLDRDGLERASCGCYAALRAQFECVAPGLYPSVAGYGVGGRTRAAAPV